MRSYLKHVRKLFLPTLMVFAISGSYGADEINGRLDSEFISAELRRSLTDPDSKVQVKVAAPRDYVFSFLTGRLDEYADGAVALEFDHAESATSKRLDQGSLRITTMDNRETLVQRFLLLNAPSEFAYFTDMERSTLSAPLKYSVTRYSLITLDRETTELSVAVTYEASSRLFTFLVNRAFNSALRRDFERAAEIIAEKYYKERLD